MCLLCCKCRNICLGGQLPAEKCVEDSFIFCLYWNWTLQISGLGWCRVYNDLLHAGWSGDWITKGAIFSAPVQTGPGPTSLLYSGYQVSFPRVKCLGHGINNSLPSSIEVKGRVDLYSLHGPSWPVVECTLQIMFTVKLNCTIYIEIFFWSIMLTTCRVDNVWMLNWPLAVVK